MRVARIQTERGPFRRLASSSIERCAQLANLSSTRLRVIFAAYPCLLHTASVRGISIVSLRMLAGARKQSPVSVSTLQICCAVRRGYAPYYEAICQQFEPACRLDWV